MEDRIKTPEEFIKEELGVPMEEQPISSMKPEQVKKTKEKKDNILEVSFLVTEKYILEQIANADDADDAELVGGVKKSSFIKYSRLNGEIEIVDKFEHNDKVYYPITDDTLQKGGILLPTGVKEYKNTKEIVDQIRQYFSERIELPVNPVNYEKFLPNLVLFYWLYDKFPFVPYVHFVGGTGTGKTTAMETFGSVCYKPIDSSSSLTIASMFRIATQWRGTLLIDEFEKVGENSKEVILFLKAGVSDRLLYRVEGERKKQVVAYVIKSPKVFTSETPINDAGLQSRTIVIKMEKNTKKLPLYRLKEDYEEAQEIRNKLLLWRLRTYDKIDLSKVRYGYPQLEVFDRRVQQILTPIYYFTDKTSRQDILTFAKEHEEDILRERRESLDGMIFEIILNYWSRGNEISIENLVTIVNEERKNRGYKSEVTSKKVGNIVKKILGFETERRGHERKYWVVRNDDQAKRKCSYYGFDFNSRTSSASSASSANDAYETAKEIF